MERKGGDSKGLFCYEWEEPITNEPFLQVHVLPNKNVAYVWWFEHERVHCFLTASSSFKFVLWVDRVPLMEPQDLPSALASFFHLCFEFQIHYAEKVIFWLCSSWQNMEVLSQTVTSLKTWRGRRPYREKPVPKINFNHFFWVEMSPANNHNTRVLAIIAKDETFDEATIYTLNMQQSLKDLEGEVLVVSTNRGEYKVILEYLNLKLISIFITALKDWYSIICSLHRFPGSLFATGGIPSNWTNCRAFCSSTAVKSVQSDLVIIRSSIFCYLSRIIIYSPALLMLLLSPHVLWLRSQCQYLSTLGEDDKGGEHTRGDRRQAERSNPWCHWKDLWERGGSSPSAPNFPSIT